MRAWIMKIATLIAVALFVSSCVVPPPVDAPRKGVVKTGLDVLIESDFAQLTGRKVGLITNHTGLDRDGVSIVKRFLGQTRCELVALFSPEHGFEGTLEGKVKSGKHESGLNVYSLYGETRKPTSAMLEGLDCLVFDIQDIGCRFYTYIATMGLCMRAAREREMHFVVLDRPNPIGGVRIRGPMLAGVEESFVGWHSLPVRHGMTVGELATLFVAEREELRGLDLAVVKCRDWTRSMLYDETGLLFVPPSPNMRNLYEATLYPGIGILETTNISVGRGTDTPFERIGAPWIDGRLLAAHLNRLGTPGVSCYPIRFTPSTSKFEGELCGGVAFVLEDRRGFDSVRFGFSVATALRDLFGESWDTKRYPRLLGNADVFSALGEGASTDELLEIAAQGVERFRDRRAAALLYD